jgi:hypothetical protein
MINFEWLHENASLVKLFPFLQKMSQNVEFDQILIEIIIEMFPFKKYFSFFSAFQFHICVSYESHIATCHNQFITLRHWLWMKVHRNYFIFLFLSQKKPHQFLTSQFKIVIFNTCSLPYKAFILTAVSQKNPKSLHVGIKKNF